MDLELVKEIKRRRNRGYSDKMIKRDLMISGHKEDAIDKALKERLVGAAEAVFYGIRKFKEHFLFLVMASAVYILLPPFLPEVLFLLLSSLGMESLGATLRIILYVFLLITLLAGFIHICLKIYREEKPTLADLFSKYRLFFVMLLATVLKYAAVILGFLVPTGITFFLLSFFGILEGITGTLILLAVTLFGFVFSVFLFLRLYFYDIYVVDLYIDPITSLKKSYNATKKAPVFSLLFMMMLVILAVNALGVPFYFLFSSLNITEFVYFLPLVFSAFSAPIVFLSAVYFYQGISGSLIKKEEVQKKGLFIVSLLFLAVIGFFFLSITQEESVKDLLEDSPQMEHMM